MKSSKQFRVGDETMLPTRTAYTKVGHAYLTSVSELTNTVLT